MEQRQAYGKKEGERNIYINQMTANPSADFSNLIQLLWLSMRRGFSSD